MTIIHRSCLSLCLLTVIACASNPPIPEQAPPPASLSPAPVETTKSSEPPQAPESPKVEKPVAPIPVWRLTEGVSTPESVLYDEANGRYLVSNINGKPDEADNNGFIMEVTPDGKVTKPKFIAGGEGKVKLDAPKGSGIAGGILYVSDITVVRKFDAQTGAPKGEIPIPGSTFLNDIAIAIAKDGRVFVSDSAVKVGQKGFEPTGTDAVYVIDQGKVKTVAKAKDLAGPNGLHPVDNGVLVVALTGDELYRLDDKGVRQDITKLPNGGLDGIVSVGDSLLITSWGASAIYRGKLGGKFEVAYAELKGPADIAFDSKRKRVLVPRFLDNAIEAYDLK